MPFPAMDMRPAPRSPAVCTVFTCNKSCREAGITQCGGQRLGPGLVVAEYHGLVEADSAQQLQEGCLPGVLAPCACMPQPASCMHHVSRLSCAALTVRGTGLTMTPEHAYLPSLRTSDHLACPLAHSWCLCRPNATEHVCCQTLPAYVPG